MQRFEIVTLVDITETGVTDNNATDAETQLKRNQQRNFDTLCQVISLRSNYYAASVGGFVFDDYFFNDPSPWSNTPPDSSFYKQVKKNTKIWSFIFETDLTDPFGSDNELLKMDLHMVPVIPALTETVPIFPPYFITSGDLTNTIVKN